ncbi:dihydrodipicolinate synthase family protein [Amycolatopsis sp. NPDC047767]|uniref:dihydrodipicolinate synthase family protein n=1 Tax=Amycolatopsis sp. NPDC047767 TaxID=3156765 RepID=UPI003452E924
MYKVFTGVIPASLMPFTAGLEIDEVNYRRHLRDLADTDGVTGIAINGHAAEVSSLTPAEQEESLRIAVDEVGDRVDILCGVADADTARAVDTARMAQEGGADGLLVFPSSVFGLGMRHRREVAVAHYAAIGAAVELPMVLFIDAAGASTTLDAALITELCERVPNITGIKDWSVDILAYEANLRAVRALPRRVSMLTSFSRALLPSLALGGDGILSGHGSMIADLQVELLRHVEAGDLKAAREVVERIHPLTEVFYAEPVLDQHNRMKVAVAMLGRIDEAHVRPPLLPIAAEERAVIADVIKGLPTGAAK